MSVDCLERKIRVDAGGFAFISKVLTVDKTANTLKVRLEINPVCFVQVYHNVSKNLVNFVLVLGQARLYGRDCDGGTWHRHPYHNPDSHDFSAEGMKEVDLVEFLVEVEDILWREGLLTCGASKECEGAEQVAGIRGAAPADGEGVGGGL